jgi:cobalt-precorrin 5A hydrolase
MELDQAMIVAGIGCRRGASEADIEAALAAALAQARIDASALKLIATSFAKAGEPGIAAVAATRGVALQVVTEHELEAAGARVVTRSARVLALTGAPSVAEAAALAAAGEAARLVVARIVRGGATCALAVTASAAPADASPSRERPAP